MDLVGPRSRNRIAIDGLEPSVDRGSVEGETHRRAAQALRSAIPDVLDAYQAGLLHVESALTEQPEPWQSCRRQAVAILEDCIATLENGCPPDTTAAQEYTRLLGANRAFQRVSVAESVRAAEVLWSAVQPAVHAAAASAAPHQRAVIQQKASAAFRAAASVRLYAGCQGYDETRDRILTSADPHSPSHSHSRETQPRTAAAPAREERNDSSEELTARERQILDAVACALTNRQIARKLGISEGTVKRHLYNVFNKLGATSRMDAVLKGAQGARRN
ncbi:helix-turn-helix transcriptional regulator [Streptomyces sp. NPDC050619]|uniref:helix-turn-helix transcriptional regulator n=1 Tax=Streptomyces sp. NPDC050619 TaxID=3157214 RepID=UPI00341ADA40